MKKHIRDTDLTILLVEDNKSIREPLQAMIQQLGGYKVLTATDGYDALAIYDQYTSEIALVITDMLMSNMNGDKLIKALYERNQDIKVICFSGSSSDQTLLSLPPVVLEWLVKPIDGKMLVETINKYLQQD